MDGALYIEKGVGEINAVDVGAIVAEDGYRGSRFYNNLLCPGVLLPQPVGNPFYKFGRIRFPGRFTDGRSLVTDT